MAAEKNSISANGGDSPTRIDSVNLQSAIQQANITTSKTTEKNFSLLLQLTTSTTQKNTKILLLQPLKKISASLYHNGQPTVNTEGQFISYPIFET